MTTQTPVALSAVRPDWQDLVAQLQNSSRLTDFSAWLDLLPIGTGETLLEFIASVGALDQYQIEAAFHGAFPSTAVVDSDIYAITQMLGIRLNRKSPMAVTATISVPSGTVYISPYSQFSGAGSYFFNRDAITVTSSPQTITLYQGKTKLFNVPGTGTDFQAFITQETDFIVSDSDVVVFINNVQVEVSPDGLWEFKGIAAVQDTTMPDGRLALMFGNDYYGVKPTVNDTVGIIYVATSGADAVALSTLNVAIGYDLNSDVSITLTSQPTGGGNENPPTVYKSVAAPLFGTFNSAVTGSQYKNLPLQYPGVQDCRTFSQRESNPRALEWMNLVRVVLLTETIWSAQQVLDFVAWLEAKTMYSTRFAVETAVAYPLTIDVGVYCQNTAYLDHVKTKVLAAISNLYTPKAGVLARDVFPSDLDDAVVNCDPSIDYAIWNTPTSPILLSRSTVGAPTAVVTNSGGTLAIGDYEYAISYVSSFGAGGQVAPANWTSAHVSVNNSTVSLSWAAVPNVSNYKVWGRKSPSAMGLLATVSGATLSWVDDGSVTPSGTLLAKDTQPMYYATLNGGSVTVSMNFSNRGSTR
jgi:hypothetical protein